MNKQQQKIDFLLAVYVAAVVVAELMGSKLFTIFNLVNASVAIFIYPITFGINDIVTEVYGKKRAISFMKSTMYILVLLVLYNVLVLALPPALRYTDNEAYSIIFGKSLRITLASLVAFFVAERLDIYIFSKIRKELGKSKLWLRNNLSNFIGQLFDTSIFMFLAFYKPGNFWFIVSLIWPYWLLKCFASVVETPLTYMGVRWLKK